MVNRSKGHQANWRSTKALVKKLMDPELASEIDQEFADGLVVKLHKHFKNGSQSTVASHLRRFQTFCKFAKKRSYIQQAPEFEMPEGIDKAKSRAVTLEEFERMLSCLPKVIKTESGHVPWETLLWGLWESGLRLGEILALSWDEGAGVVVEQNGSYWGFRFNKQKNKRNQWIPMTRVFYDRFVAQADTRTGRLFPMPHRRGSQMSAHRASAAIGSLGRAAGVKTGEAKHASAHDLRRAFSIRMARQLDKRQLACVMRHKSHKTTDTFYPSAEELIVAEELWGDT